MKHWYYYIFSLFFALSATVANAQLETPDSTTQVKTKRGLGFDFYIDYGKLLTYPSQFESKLDFGVGLVYNQFGLALEGGYAKLTPEDAIQNGEYTSEGTYYKAGIDYYRVFKGKFLVMGGLRYAHATFDDKGFGEIDSDLWNNNLTAFERTGETAQWAEIVLGTDAQFLKQRWLWVGWKLRVKILMNKNDYAPIDILAIPGYGRTLNKSVPSMNFYLRIKI